MANKIRIKRSTVPGKAPTAGDLEVGELAVNTADGVLYTKHTDGNVITISPTKTSNIYNNAGITATETPTLIDTVKVEGNISIRWAITAKDNVNNTVKSSTVDTINDGTNVYSNEFSILTSNVQVNVVSFTSNISSGNVLLWATGDSSNVTVIAQRISLGASTVAGYV